MTDPTATPADEWADDLPDDWTPARRPRHTWRTLASTAATASIVLLPLGGAAGYAYGQHQQPEPQRVLVPVTADRCAAALQKSLAAQLDAWANR